MQSKLFGRTCFLASSENPQLPLPASGADTDVKVEGASGAPSGPGSALDQATLSQGAVIAPPPPRDPAWNGWDVLLIAALALMAIVVLVVFFGVGAHLIWPEVSLNAMAPLIAVTAQFLAYVIVAFFTIMLVEGKYHVRFWQAVRWNWPRAGWRMLALGVLTLLSVNLLAHFLPMPKSTPFDQFFSSPRDAYLIAVFAVTFGPFMEELFFRGMLYPVLARQLGMFWGVVLTALPFALMHMFQYGYAWGVVLLIFIMGVVCTLVRAMTGSVAASFLVHVGYNATEMVALLVATDGFRHMEKAALALN